MPPGSPLPHTASAASFPLARLLTRTAGLPALVRAAPAFAALALASAIIFGGNGMSPADLVGAAQQSLPLRSTLWTVWILLTIPPARAIVETPETFFLRALPVPRWHFSIVHALHLALLQGPWAVLWLLGGGLLSGLTAILAAIALLSSWIAGLRRARDAVAPALTLAALAAPIPAPARFALALLAAPIALDLAFVRAPDRGIRAGSGWVRGGPLRALALAHTAILLRRDRVLFGRSALAVLAGAIVLALVVRNNPDLPLSFQAALLLVGPLPLALGTGGVAIRVLDTERSLTWLLLATGTSAARRALLALLIPAALGALLGAIFGLLGAALAAPPLLARSALDGMILGALVGSAAGHAARSSELPSGVDGSRAVVVLLLASVLIAAAGASLGEIALPLLSLGAALLARASVASLARADRLRDPTRHAPLGAG
ncbi:MAG: hypothetical protein U0359_02875 [Byssovorax sp.]